MFHEICEGKLTITNTGNSPFDVSVKCDEETDTPEPGWLTVIPTNRTVNSGKSFSFTVRYYPGLTGHFSRKFLVNVCYVILKLLSIFNLNVFRSIIWILLRSSLPVTPSFLKLV